MPRGSISTTFPLVIPKPRGIMCLGTRALAQIGPQRRCATQCGVHKQDNWNTETILFHSRITAFTVVDSTIGMHGTRGTHCRLLRIRWTRGPLNSLVQRHWVELAKYTVASYGTMSGSKSASFVAWPLQVCVLLRHFGVCTNGDSPSGAMA